jgi:hypothetical protein
MALNKKRLLQLADVLEAHSIPDVGFNMWTFYIELDKAERGLRDYSNHKCGTVACIAGHTLLLFEENGRRILEERSFVDDISQKAAEILGLRPWQTSELFYQTSIPTRGGRQPITPQHAARVIRHLAATGEVDWEKALV